MLSLGAFSRVIRAFSSPLVPATPSTIKLSLVSVPVLSKQQYSTFPANGIRKGSVQNIESFTSCNNDVFTAKDNSIGNSGGTTDVNIKVHSRNNLYLFRSGSSVPFIHKYADAAIAKIRRNKMKQMKNSKLPRKPWKLTVPSLSQMKSLTN